jgi:hypothetical protein
VFLSRRAVVKLVANVLWVSLLTIYDFLRQTRRARDRGAGCSPSLGSPWKFGIWDAVNGHRYAAVARGVDCGMAVVRCDSWRYIHSTI